MVEPTKPNDDVSKVLEAVICDPLKHSWTFWLETPAIWRQAARGSSIRPIHTFSHVEMFWSLDNNVHHPIKLTRRTDLYCFKNHIVPNWEDPIYANGGRWTATFQKGNSDNAWMQSMLAMIEEKFDHGDEICGAVVNVRSRYDRISLWIKDADNEAAQLSIGKQWKEFLDYKEQIGFIFHVDDKRLNGNAKSRFTA